jgi:hypothetical protein
MAQKSAPLCDLMLSVRWSSLATWYSALELWDRSLVAAAVAILFDCLESASLSGRTDCSLHMSLLHQLNSFSKGAINLGPSDYQVSSKNRPMLVARLLNTLRQSKQGAVRGTLSSTSSALAFLPTQAARLLLEAEDVHPVALVFETICGVSFGFGNVLRVLLTPHVTSSFRAVDPIAFAVEVASTFAGIICGMGQLLQLGKCHTGVLMIDFLELCRFAMLSTQQMQLGVLVHSLLSVVASMALLPCSSYMTFEEGISVSSTKQLLVYSYEHIERASNILLDSDESNDAVGNLLVSSVRMATQFARSQHPHARSVSNSIAIDAVVVEVREFVDILASTHQKCDAVTAAKYCAVQAIARLSDVLSYHGNYLDAAQMAFWNMEISPLHQSEAVKSWLEDTVFLRNMTGSVLSVAPLVQQMQCRDSIFHDDLEKRACHLRVKILSSAKMREQKDYSRELRKLLLEVDAALSSTNDFQTGNFLLWTKSTVILGLADCADRQGDLEGTLRCLRECLVFCRKLKGLLAASRSKHCNSCTTTDVFWVALAASSLYPRTVVRQVECLQHLTVVLSRVGDYRKAMSYSETLLSSFGSGLGGGLHGKSSFAELHSFFRLTDSNCLRDLQLRRILLCLRAKSTPLDIVCATDEIQSPFADTQIRDADCFSGSGSLDLEQILVRLQRKQRPELHTPVKACLLTIFLSL